jgi:hypothetical protein
VTIVHGPIFGVAPLDLDHPEHYFRRTADLCKLAIAYSAAPFIKGMKNQNTQKTAVVEKFRG